MQHDTGRHGRKNGWRFLIPADTQCPMPSLQARMLSNDGGLHRSVMAHPALRGRSILVVENELLIAMDIAQGLESAGANATKTTTVRRGHALGSHARDMRVTNGGWFSFGFR